MGFEPRSLLALLVALIVATACSGGGSPTPTLDPPTGTASPRRPSPTAFPTFTPTPTLQAGSEIVVGGDLRTRAAPTTQSAVVSTLHDLQTVQIARAVRGENWLVGTQNWLSTIPDWTSTWYQLQDNSYVYAAFVFLLQPGEMSPLADAHGQEKWVDVNVTTQTATAMVGDQAIYTALVSTGSPDFPSPQGTHKIEKDGRLAVERMTATQAGYNPSQARYDVERVLFTQYYDTGGDALHLNYWRPEEVFGHQATSHGCVGMQVHDAQYFWLFGSPGMRVELHS